MLGLAADVNADDEADDGKENSESFTGTSEEDDNAKEDLENSADVGPEEEEEDVEERGGGGGDGG